MYIYIYTYVHICADLNFDFHLVGYMVRSLEIAIDTGQWLHSMVRLPVASMAPSFGCFWAEDRRCNMGGQK